jgi:thioredoxin-like negative regulator of GroEL
LHIGTTDAGCPLDAFVGVGCPSAFSRWLQQLRVLDAQVAQVEPARAEAIDHAIEQHHLRAGTMAAAARTDCKLSLLAHVVLGDADVARALAALPELSAFERLPPDERAKQLEALLANANDAEDRVLVQESFQQLESSRDLRLMHAMLRSRWRSRTR